MIQPEAILEVQRLDTETEQLRHRRAGLEQRALLEKAETEQAALQKGIDHIEVQRVEVASRQRRLEDEATIVSDRADKDDSRLYSGEVQGLKDLQALQEEITGLRARQADLEEQALEAMVEADELAQQISERRAAKASTDERVTVLTAELAAAEAEVDAEIDRAIAARAAAAEQVDPAVLSRYERTYPNFGAATAVGFDESTGCLCPSSMPAVEFDRVKRCDPGSVLECEECGRIVVR